MIKIKTLPLKVFFFLLFAFGVEKVSLIEKLCAHCRVLLFKVIHFEKKNSSEIWI